MHRRKPDNACAHTRNTGENDPTPCKPCSGVGGPGCFTMAIPGLGALARENMPKVFGKGPTSEFNQPLLQISLAPDWAGTARN